MEKWNALEEAVQRFGESIAEFPIGAVSVNDLKPTEEKISDLRATLKIINNAIINLRAMEEARAISNLPEESVQDTYDVLQDQMVNCAINNEAVEVCLYSDAIEQIFHSTKDTEMKTALHNRMCQMFTLNDQLIALEKKRLKVKERETELTIEFKESLLEFKDFLKEQEIIRKRKLEQTNPQVAEQKAQMQIRVEKMNMIKRIITNMIAANGDMLQTNSFLQEMMRKHRELVDPEMITKMARQISDEESS